MKQFKQKLYSESSRELFLNFVCRLEGWKTKCKNLHWAAPAKNIHEYLDDFLGVISEYQDTLAETYMGFLGKMGPSDVKGIPCIAGNAQEFIQDVFEGTKKFYEEIPEDIEFKGIASETETFIKDIEKYKYLFRLCAVD